MENLLSEIQAFCNANNVAPSTFGRKAMNDASFVSNLESGRRVWPENADKVRKFMASYTGRAQ